MNRFCTKNAIAIAIGLVVAGLALSGCAEGQAGTAGPAGTAEEAAPPSGGVNAIEVFRSATRADWQARADAIVVAHVSDERRHPRSEPEAYMDPEGWELVGRTITVDITQVVWSAPSKAHRLKNQLSFLAYGWFDNTHRSVEAVIGSGSRLEVGHDYVLALRWYPGRRDPENLDDVVRASWNLLGSDAALPVDGGVIGRGEYQGEVTRGLTADEVPAG